MLVAGCEGAGLQGLEEAGHFPAGGGVVVMDPGLLEDMAPGRWRHRHQEDNASCQNIAGQHCSGRGIRSETVNKM